MICATCRNELPVRLFVVRRWSAGKRSESRRVPWCRDCRRRHRETADERPRALGTNPRALGTNPRAKATNPHPGKSERAGQWRAAFRRIDRMAPDEAHRRLVALDRERDALPAEVVDELRRRLPDRRP